MGKERREHRMNFNRGLLVLGLFWLFLTLVFDAFPAYIIVSDYKTDSYTLTDGHILESHVDTVVSHSTKGGQSISYQPTLSYTYRVDGRQLRGDHVTSIPFASSGSYASETVARYPAGATVPVYYDPSDPSTSVLENGVQGTPLFMLLFLVPFNSIGLLLIRLSLLPEPLATTGGIEIVNERNTIRCTSPSMDRFLLLCLLFCATGFGLAIVFVIALGMTPSVPVALGEWVALLAVTTLLYKSKVSRAREPEIILNPTRGEISGPTIPMNLKYSEVADLSVIPVTKRFTLQITKTGGEQISLFDWADEASATVFADWLKKQLGM